MLTRTALCAAVLSCFACSGSSRPAPAAPAAPAADAPPAAGVASIRADDLRAHVELLASDEYAGRETLAPGADLAAAHLAAQFRAYGLAPMPGRDDFDVPYTLYQLGYDEAATVLVAGGKTYDAGVDYTPFQFSDDGEAEGAVVFAGYGITAPEQNWDDYEGLDVTGKIVLVLRHTPNEKADPDPFAKTQHAAFLTKALNAQSHGAAGMILVTDPLHHQDGDDMRMRSMLLTEPIDLAKQRAEAAKREPKDQPKFRAVHVSQSVAAELVASTGKELLDIQRAVDNGAKPSAFQISGVSATIGVKASDELRTVTARNVAGFLRGSDPKLADEWIVIGAHYDHLGAFGGGGDSDVIYNGADDNASGTAGMLELAQAFAALPEAPARSILFIGFSGEEKGLLGSRALIDQKLVPLDKLVFMLNLDMIGRNPERPVEVVGDGYSDGIAAAVQAASDAEKLAVELGGSSYSGNSDHHPFYASDVPFLFFFTGLHDDYHQLSDHSDKVAFDRMEQIVKVAYGTVAEVASGKLTPHFVHHITWLGVEVQVRDGAAVITAVEPDSRASEAGLEQGDALRYFGDVALEDPKQVGKKFRDIEPGTTISLGVARGGDSKSIRVERAKQGFLGVFPGRASDEERQALGLGDDEGVKITSLTDGGPAAKAGILAGDILIRIHGLPVSTRTLGLHLARIGAGELVKIVVVRNGERVELDLVLGERPERNRP
jgi:hypothetical protein